MRRKSREVFELAHTKLRVEAAFCDKLVVHAFLDNVAVF